MKTIINVLIICLLTFSITTVTSLNAAYANTVTLNFTNICQDDQGKIESMLIAYLVNKLELNADESSAFSPLYSAYRKEIKSVKQEIKTVNGSSESAASKLTKRQTLEQQLLDIKNTYEGKFQQVLPIEKVAKIAAAEQEFKSILMESINR